MELTWAVLRTFWWEEVVDFVKKLFQKQLSKLEPKIKPTNSME